VPVLDISEVGAGGGSIVWIDRGGALKVGPRSAGAVPGPVCYGRGGQEPTVTDANVVLGYINPRGLAGGTVPIDLDRAAASLAPRAAELGMALDEFAYGVFTIANATMIRAIKAVSTYRGRDPRDFALLAFGGSGPIHAAGIARELGMRRVIVPPAPGLFSAVGLLAARRERHIVQTFFSAAAEIDLSALNAVYAGVETRARTAMAADRADGDIVCRRTADLRYVGQGYELTVPAPAGSLTPSALATLVEVFEQEHERTYGHRAEREPVELVNLRVSAHVVGDRPRAAKLAGHDHASIVSSRRSYFGPEAGFMTTPVIDRSALTPDPRPGPLIIEEYDTTTIVPPDRVAWRDASDNIMLDPA
jgi:N-methylhydantoinase A